VRIPAGGANMDASRTNTNTKTWSGTFTMKAAGTGAAKIGKIQFGTAGRGAGFDLSGKLTRNTLCNFLSPGQVFEVFGDCNKQTTVQYFEPKNGNLNRFIARTSCN